MPVLPVPFKTPLDSLIETAATEPDLSLVIENASTIRTYADIFQRIQRVGSHLIRENIQIVGIHTKLEILHVVGTYSAFYAGIPFVHV